MTDLSQSENVICYVALGSNLGDSEKYLKNAVTALQNHSSVFNLIRSSLYQSKPHGPQDQPDYINAAVRFETNLKAETLLDELQAIENKNQRLRTGVERWGARTLDLDLLFYGVRQIKTKRLIVPHPRICERAFVLLPLQDIVKKLKLNADDLKITPKTTINDCIDALSKSDLKDIKRLQ